MGVDSVEIREIKEVNLRGGTVVAAFPSVGLVSTIAATYMITTLETDQVCALESLDFPPISMIYARKPKFPARVYAWVDHPLAIFLCETPLPLVTHRPVAYALMKWAHDHGARQIVSLEGLPTPDGEASVAEPAVHAVGSTDRARADLEKYGVPQLETGMITGVTGVLLNEGRWRGVDVIALLTDARPNIPDARAAVALVKALDTILPEITIELGPLVEEAKVLEEQIGRLRDQVRHVVPPAEPVPPGYR